MTIPRARKPRRACAMSEPRAAIYVPGTPRRQHGLSIGPSRRGPRGNGVGQAEARPRAKAAGHPGRRSSRQHAVVVASGAATSRRSAGPYSPSRLPKGAGRLGVGCLVPLGSAVARRWRNRAGRGGGDLGEPRGRRAGRAPGARRHRRLVAARGPDGLVTWRLGKASRGLVAIWHRERRRAVPNMRSHKSFGILAGNRVRP